MGPVTLRIIDDENRAAVEELSVSPGQERFVDGVRASLQEAAAYSPQPWCRAVYAGDTPLGFIMLADNDPTCSWRYFLWRFLIDRRFQRLGYGRASLDHLVTHLRTRPGADALVTSVAHYDGPLLDEASPMAFYLNCGFQPTGQIKDREIVIQLGLM